jgi:hypothetical protein
VQNLASVEPGQLRAAEHSGQRGRAVLGRDAEAVVEGEGSVEGEFVEPRGRALDGGEVGGVGEELGRCPDVLGVLGGTGGGRQRGV